MKKPSEIKNMCVSVSKLILKGYAMMFFGKILTYNENAKKNIENNVGNYLTHETIHLKQAVSTSNSFFVFYLEYILRYLKSVVLVVYGFKMPYYLNPFEMEAYAFENKKEHSEQDKCEEWKVFDRMSWKEKLTTAKELKAWNGSKQEFFLNVYNTLVSNKNNRKTISIWTVLKKIKL